jgi:hydrogenase maturation protein HypF
MSVIEHVIKLPHAVKPILGVGAFLKNTVCLLAGDQAYLSRINGDLGTPEAIAAFEQSVAGLIKEVGVAPQAVAHDFHPDFYSTRFAQGLGLPCHSVQHHHAHIAAVMAEREINEPVVGLSLDGFGLGPNKQSWGGELLYVAPGEWRRLGHLALLAQPGGDKAARQPWRMGAAALYALGRGGEIATRFVQHQGAEQLAMLLEKGLNSPLTSSAGRLFDAACGLLDVVPVAQFEGEAPMKLESLVENPCVMAGGWHLGEDGVLDFAPLLSRLADDVTAKEGAELFHGTLAAGLREWSEWGREQSGAKKIVLGGGCFLNKILRQGLGEDMLGPERLSPGDAGLSLGQAWAAAEME